MRAQGPGGGRHRRGARQAGARGAGHLTLPARCPRARALRHASRGRRGRVEGPDCLSPMLPPLPLPLLHHLPATLLTPPPPHPRRPPCWRTTRAPSSRCPPPSSPSCASPATSWASARWRWRGSCRWVLVLLFSFSFLSRGGEMVGAPEGVVIVAAPPTALRALLSALHALPAGRQRGPGAGCAQGGQRGRVWQLQGAARGGRPRVGGEWRPRVLPLALPPVLRRLLPDPLLVPVLHERELSASCAAAAHAAGLTRARGLAAWPLPSPPARRCPTGRC
jgi:hypothetical protein